MFLIGNYIYILKNWRSFHGSMRLLEARLAERIFQKRKELFCRYIQYFGNILFGSFILYYTKLPPAAHIFRQLERPTKIKLRQGGTYLWLHLRGLESTAINWRKGEASKSPQKVVPYQLQCCRWIMGICTAYAADCLITCYLPPKTRIVDNPIQLHLSMVVNAFR